MESSAFFVALSGGMDSCVLLDLLAIYTNQHTKMRLFVLHFDHGLQEQSAQWCRFCENLAKQYNVDFYSSNSGVVIDKSIGLEASASKARYQWFAEIMTKISFEKNIQNAVIMTAHHSDDQAETVLMNILRGTGLKGLRGIAEKKTLIESGSFKQFLLRPLLSFSRVELQGYAENNSLEWIEDPSNSDSCFRRNDLRKNVMPELKRIRPDAINQILKLTRHICDTDNLLTELAINDLAFTKHFDFCPLDGSYGLNLEGLRGFSVSRQMNAIRVWLGMVGYPAESEMDLLQVLQWSMNGANSGAELRRGKRVYRYYHDALYVMPVKFAFELCIDGQSEWRNSQHAQPAVKLTENGYQFDMVCSAESRFFGKPLMIATIGCIEDVYLPNGEGHIQAKKCFQSAKVPPWRRASALFVVSEDHRFIELVGGQKQRDFYLLQTKEH